MLYIVRPYHLPVASSCPFVHSILILVLSYNGDSAGIYFFHKISASELDFEMFSCSSEVFCSFFFFHFSLFDSAPFQYSQLLINPLFYKCLDSVVLSPPWFLLSHYSLSAGHIFKVKFHSNIQALFYILIVCIKVSCSFSFLTHILISSIYIRWFILSCDFLNF